MVASLAPVRRDGLTAAANFLTLVAMTKTTTVPAATPDSAIQGSISAAYLAVLEDYLRPHDLRVADVPLGAELLRRRDDGAIVVSAQDWRALLTHFSRQLSQPDLGLRLGQSARLTHLGLLGYFLQSCVTLGAALERLQHYERLVNDINRLQWRQASGADGVEVALTWGVERGRPGPLVDECAVATLMQITRQITGRPDAPAGIDFVNPAPADPEPYRQFFQCPVRFDQAQTCVRFPLDWLQLPLQHRDPKLLAILEKQVDELLKQLPDEDDFVQQVRRLMAQRLRQGRVTLADIAQDMHLSERTLHRRLQEADTNFRALWESTRQHLAQEYLRDRQLTLTEIADLLGFSEQSAFTRSFRRWTGQGPKAWRSRRSA